MDQAVHQAKTSGGGQSGAAYRSQLCSGSGVASVCACLRLDDDDDERERVTSPKATPQKTPEASPQRAQAETLVEATPKAKAKAAKAKATPLGGAGGGQAGRGRPSKNMMEEAMKMHAEMMKTDPSDKLWWGTESKTQAKVLRDAAKATNGKLKKATDLDTSNELQKAEKVFKAMLALVEVASAHGFLGSKFDDEFDNILGKLTLDPAVELKWPKFITWARSKADIQSTSDDQRWMARLSSEALVRNGVAKDKVASEQFRLVAERVSKYLKLNKGEIAVLFNLESAFPFDDKVSAVCEGIAACLHYESFDGLEERIDILTEGLDTLAQSIPDAAKKVQGDLIGSTLIQDGFASPPVETSNVCSVS